MLIHRHKGCKSVVEKVEATSAAQQLRWQAIQKRYFISSSPLDEHALVGERNAPWNRHVWSLLAANPIDSNHVVNHADLNPLTDINNSSPSKRPDVVQYFRCLDCLSYVFASFISSLVINHTSSMGNSTLPVVGAFGDVDNAEKGVYSGGGCEDSELSMTMAVLGAHRDRVQERVRRAGVAAHGSEALQGWEYCGPPLPLLTPASGDMWESANRVLKGASGDNQDAKLLRSSWLAAVMYGSTTTSSSNEDEV